MNKKELTRMIVIQFFISYTCTMFATILFCKLSVPECEELPVSFLWKAAFFSLCSVLVGVVYYSKEELTKRKWWIRTIIHTILLETVLLIVGYQFEMYRGIGGFVLFFCMILLVDVFVRLVSYGNDKKMADEINTNLRKKREK